MAAANEPFNTSTTDQDKVSTRRDIVSRLGARQLKPHQILKMLLANKQTAWLITGYKNPYQVIRNDIKKGPTDLHRVTVDVAATALRQYIVSLETQLEQVWADLENGISDSEGLVVQLAATERIKYIELANKLSQDLAKAQGIQTESVPSIGPNPGPAGSQINIFGTGPEALMGAARAAKALAEGKEFTQYEEHSDRKARSVELEPSERQVPDPREGVIDSAALER